MDAEPGLRERKKRQTRDRLIQTARRLFAERGFDAVTVAEVARAAGVSEGTVFNYFPAKEDLFYDGTEAFEALFVEVVRERPPGASVLSAFRGFVLDSTTRLAAEEITQVVAEAAQVIADSRALQIRERAIVARYAESLTSLIAEETGVGDRDLEAQAAANALMGVQQALVAYIRTEARDGRQGPTLAADVESQAARAFARLEIGLGDYALKEG